MASIPLILLIVGLVFLVCHVIPKLAMPLWPSVLMVLIWAFLHH